MKTIVELTSGYNIAKEALCAAIQEEADLALKVAVQAHKNAIHYATTEGRGRHGNVIDLHADAKKVTEAYRIALLAYSGAIQVHPDAAIIPTVERG